MDGSLHMLGAGSVRGIGKGFQRLRPRAPPIPPPQDYIVGPAKVVISPYRAASKFYGRLNVDPTGGDYDVEIAWVAIRGGKRAIWSGGMTTYDAPAGVTVAFQDGRSMKQFSAPQFVSVFGGEKQLEGVGGVGFDWGALAAIVPLLKGGDGGGGQTEARRIEAEKNQEIAKRLLLAEEVAKREREKGESATRTGLVVGGVVVAALGGMVLVKLLGR